MSYNKYGHFDPWVFVSWTTVVQLTKTHNRNVLIYCMTSMLHELLKKCFSFNIDVVSVFQPSDAQTLAVIAVSLRRVCLTVSHTECTALSTVCSLPSVTCLQVHVRSDVKASTTIAHTPDTMYCCYWTSYTKISEHSYLTIKQNVHLCCPLLTHMYMYTHMLTHITHIYTHM